MARALSRFRLAIFCALVLSGLGGLLYVRQRPAQAWWSGGHKMVSIAALKMLPEDVPEFFRKAEEEIADMSLEPDEWKSQMSPRLKASEGSEHFIDLELMNGGAGKKGTFEGEGKYFHRHRYEALKWYASIAEEKKIDLSKCGTLPYALEEGYERLLLTFRQVRIYPEKEGPKHRAIMYAGWLAHYCGDAGMPLHTTVNYDGKPGEDGAVIQKGIHARLDGYPEKNGFTPEMLAEKQTAERLTSVWATIENTIHNSHLQVEKCYELDKDGGFAEAPEKAKEFVLERARISAKLTADIWYTAWVKSDPKKATIK